jgi:ATP-binding cassette subfamily B protein
MVSTGARAAAEAGRTTPESQWRFLASMVRPHRRAFTIYGLVLAAATTLPVVGALLLARFVDELLQGATLRDAAPWGVGTTAVSLLVAVLQVLVAWRSTELAWRITNGLRHELADHVLRADLAFHRDRTPGELLTRCDADVTALTTFLASVVARVLGIALLAVVSTVVLAFVEPRLAPVLAVGYTAVGATIWRSRDHSAAAVLTERAIDAEMHSVVEQYVAGADDVASLGAGTHGLRRFAAHASALTDATGERVGAEMRVQAAIRSSIALVMVAVLAVGGVGLARGWTTITGVLVAFRLVQLVRLPIESLVWRLQETQGISGATRRVMDLLAERRAVVSGTAHLPHGPLDVVFERSRLVYDDAAAGEAALDGLDLRLDAGRSLGLVGRTGSGKTSVARLVLRLVAPTSGRVLLGGVDATTLDDDAFRSRVVAIPQDVQLFPGTVRDNVTMFAEVDDTTVLAALRDAGLQPWLDSLERGLDTLLASDARTDERDPAARVGLSAGQAQLLAIARALLRAPDVVVLDEATSRVDPATQDTIAAALRTLVAGRTALVVAHRLETLDLCDDIAVLEQGVLVEHGPRAQLAADPTSRYARLRAGGLRPDRPVGPAGGAPAEELA